MFKQASGTVRIGGKEDNEEARWQSGVVFKPFALSVFWFPMVLF